jgi:hypothetical protein
MYDVTIAGTAKLKELYGNAVMSANTLSLMLDDATSQEDWHVREQSVREAWGRVAGIRQAANTLGIADSELI